MEKLVFAGEVLDLEMEKEGFAEIQRRLNWAVSRLPMCCVWKIEPLVYPFDRKPVKWKVKVLSTKTGNSIVCIRRTLHEAVELVVEVTGKVRVVADELTKMDLKEAREEILRWRAASGVTKPEQLTKFIAPLSELERWKKVSGCNTPEELAEYLGRKP